MDSETERTEMECFIHSICSDSSEGAIFLISTFFHSLTSHRKCTVCAPFPPFLFKQNKVFTEKDFSAALEAMSHFPPLQSIVNHPLSHSHLPKSVEDSNETNIHYNNIKEKASVSSNCINNSSFLIPPSTSLPNSESMSDLNKNPLEIIPFPSLKLMKWILCIKKKISLLPSHDDHLLRLLSSCTLFKSSPSLLLNLYRTMKPKPNYVLKVDCSYDSNNTGDNIFFDNMCAKNGSFFAFHGTKSDCLHSILRCGLVSGSGTDLQRNGNLFGNGVYFSIDPMVALNFSSTTNQSSSNNASSNLIKQSLHATSVSYLLLCEIANGDYASFVSKSGKCVGLDGVDSHAYVVVNNIDSIRLRYVFVFGNLFQIGKEGWNEFRANGAISNSKSKSKSKPRNGLDLTRVNWFKWIVCLYVSLLLFLGLLNSTTFRKSWF